MCLDDLKPTKPRLLDHLLPLLPHHHHAIAEHVEHPRQRQVVEDLAGFARPYLSRLWARLHGRDVWQEPCDDVDDVRALLEGVARSVSLDHRQRIKTMLEMQVAQ